MIARDPKCGTVIPGTAGVRKVRFAIGGRGKRGGARIVYYFYNERFPVFLITVFAKNERSDLAHSERNDLAKLVKALIEKYEVKR